MAGFRLESAVVRENEEKTMSILVIDPALSERLLAQRRESDGDRFDEVWDGLYIMSPLANDEHQELAGRLGFVYQAALGFDSPHKVYPGINVSDREEDWSTTIVRPTMQSFYKATPGPRIVAPTGAAGRISWTRFVAKATAAATSSTSTPRSAYARSSSPTATPGPWSFTACSRAGSCW